MTKPTNRRQGLIVSRPVQSRIIFTVSWPAAVALVTIAVFLAVLCSRLSQEALEAKVDLPSVVPIFLTVMVFLVVATAYVLLNALKFSHRIAGPMYRLNKTLEAVQAGDLKCRANLRDGDFLGDVADHLNGFLDWLEQHPPQGVGKRAGAAAAEGELDVTPQGGGIGPRADAVDVVVRPRTAAAERVPDPGE